MKMQTIKNIASAIFYITGILLIGEHSDYFISIGVYLMIAGHHLEWMDIK